jgi:hypothetical protein
MTARQVPHPHEPAVEAAALLSFVPGDCQQLVLIDAAQRRGGEADLDEVRYLGYVSELRYSSSSSSTSRARTGRSPPVTRSR